MALQTTGLSLLACLIYSLPALALAMGTADGETVRVTATPAFPVIPWAQQRDDFEVLVHVEAPAAARVHAPIDLVALLDVSDSMNAPATSLGGPSRLDLLKKAMKFVISKLDNSDRLAIVAFNDHVVQEYSTDLLRMSRDGGCGARRKVDELMAGGPTAFKPALERAVQILDERPMEDERVGFVLLLSDGIEDGGIKWCKKGICRTSLFSNYPVHTFGFSASHDPLALHLIAKASHGTYSFVNENLDSITSAFAVCLGGLKSVVATRIRIKLMTADQAGVEINSIESGGYQKHVSSDRTRGEILLDVLYAGEVKNFIVRLRVPTLGATCGFDHHRQQQLLTLAADFSSYSHATGVDGAITEEGKAVVLYIQRPQVVADAGWQTPSPTVVSQIVLFELVELVAKFVHHEVDGVIAKVDLGGRLEQEWEAFTEQHKFWSGVDLGHLDSDISAMVSSLRRSGSGTAAAAYIYSWVSSYRMQRATTMGSPDKVVPEFTTAKMRLMLKEAREFQEPINQHPWAGGQDDNLDIFEMMDRRLDLWYKLKREVPILFRRPSDSSEDAEWNHLTAITQDLSLESINRAMHHDMYLAVVHARNMRRCYSKREGTEGRGPGTGTGTAC